jgi:amino acid permease
MGVIGNSIGGAFGLYFFISIAGYLTFGNDVKGNIVSQCEFVVRVSEPC